MKARLLLILLSVSIFTCSGETEVISEIAEELENNDSSSTTPNILFIIADDMGLDACPGYNRNL